MRLLLTQVLAVLLATGVGSAQSADHRSLHVLDRFTFGANSAELAEINRVVPDRWFEEQLHPERLNDADTEARVARFLTLTMTPSELAQAFPSNQMVKAIAQGKMQLPSDPETKAIYQTAVARYQRKIANKKQGEKDRMESASDEPALPRATPQRMQQFLAQSPQQQYSELVASPDDVRRSLFRSLTPQQRADLYSQVSPKQQETLLALLSGPAAVINSELAQAKILRATYSHRQLEEVMADFWFNHFNVFLNKGQERYLIASYEHDAIRPHALGKFKDLLLATAHSPAMLFYLDNAESVGPHSQFVERPRFAMAQNKKRPQGINENYARELMELHTMGVAGGYTQQDVSELAKILSGWTVTRPRTGDIHFEFRPALHEPGDKVLLGRKIRAAGEREGIEALELLAQQPATARFISRKLAMRFVSDDPPQPIVDRMAATFQKTDGDIREVLRTMYHSPEFWDQRFDRAKAKTPLEFVVSSLRATGAEVTNALALAQVLRKMGMPLYAMQPPTGYPMTQDAWINSAALLDRFNFAIVLAANRIPGVAVPETGNVTDQQLEAALLHMPPSPQTRSAIEAQLQNPSLARTSAGSSVYDGDEMHLAKEEGRNRHNGGAFPRASAPPTRQALVTALVLGSPEFQKR